MYCENCGKKLNDGADVCLNCWHQVKKKANVMESGHYNIPPEYKPISMWGYFGYEILFMIPIIGWLLLIIFALGGTSNINLKNFARSYFCLLIIIVIFFIFSAVLTAGYFAAR